MRMLAIARLSVLLLLVVISMACAVDTNSDTVGASVVCFTNALLDVVVGVLLYDAIGEAAPAAALS